jgi:hypothetical protein
MRRYVKLPRQFNEFCPGSGERRNIRDFRASIAGIVPAESHMRSHNEVSGNFRIAFIVVLIGLLMLTRSYEEQR